MNFEVIYILFWLYSCLGWIMETSLVSIQSQKFINRGFYLGPYCPIYGTGALLLLVLKNYQNDPLVVFILAILICSLVEYITSYLMEQIYKIRWWDYSNRFFNIKGRICLFNSICFGFLGMFIVCYLNPFFLNIITNVNTLTLHIITFIIFISTTTDILITNSIMFDIRKTVIDFKEKTITNLFKPNTDNTEEISQKIRNILKEKSIIHKHLSKSFSNLKVYKNNFLKKTEEFIKYKKDEKQENSFIISSLISIIIGLIIGNLFNNIGLFLSIFIVLNIIINKIINRSNNDK